MLIVAVGIFTSCNDSSQKSKQASLKDISYEAFVYAYPMMEQVKTINRMVDFMG